MSYTAFTKLTELGFEVADHTTAMLAYWDKNLICRFANKAHVDWYGIDPKEMIDTITLQKFLGSEFTKTLPYITEVLKGNVQTFERVISSATGKIRHSIATYSPDIVNEEVTGFYVHVADLTPLNNKLLYTSNQDDSVPQDDLLFKIDKILRSSLITGFPGITKLAKQHFISESKLKRDFKEKYKTSIFSYYRHLQMEYAEKYISEKKCSMKQMASMLKFINPSNFSACYKKYLKEISTKRLIEKIKKDDDDRYKTFITQSPYAIAMFDTNMRFLAASQKWIDDYYLTDKKFIGNTLYEVFPDTEPRWKAIYAECLNGKIQKADEELFYKTDGLPIWLRWDIRPWYTDKHDVGGLFIFTEDISALKQKEDEHKQIMDILNKTKEIIRIGIWKRNFKTNASIWSKVIKQILEVEEDYQPTLETAINFYKEGPSRELVKKSVTDAIHKGMSFDIEAELITAKGKEKRVRVIGYPKFINGKCEELSGIFHDITHN